MLRKWKCCRDQGRVLFIAFITFIIITSVWERFKDCKTKRANDPIQDEEFIQNA